MIVNESLTVAEGHGVTIRGVSRDSQGNGIFRIRFYHGKREMHAETVRSLREALMQVEHFAAVVN